MSLLAVLLAGALQAQAQTAHFAGAQITLDSGFFVTPGSMAIDANGDLFVADTAPAHIGIWEIPAGSPGTHVSIGSGWVDPKGVAVDSIGNVFVADGGAPHVGVWGVLAGNYAGAPAAIGVGTTWTSPNGVAVDSSFNVYASDRAATNGVWKIAAGSYSNPATLITNTITDPRSLAVDGSGNLFVTDSSQVVRKIPYSGGVYLAPAQIAPAFTFTNVKGVALDKNGNLFVVDMGRNAVDEILNNAGSYTTVITVAGGIYNAPAGVALDPIGNIYIADSGNNAIKKVITSNASFGSVNVGALSSPLSLLFTFDTGGTIGTPSVLTQGTANLDFTDALTGTCNTNGASFTYNAGDTCTVNVRLTPKAPGMRLGAVEILKGGTLLATGYVSGTGMGPQINFLPGAEAPVTVTGSTNLVGAAVDAAGNVYAGDSTLFQVHQVDQAGGGSTYLVADLSGFPAVPRSMAVDGAGNVLIADPNNGMIRTVPPGATPHTFLSAIVLASALNQPEGVAVDGGGNIYIANAAGASKILKMSPTATGGYTVPSPISTITPLNSPYGIQVDGAGNLYIADYGGNKVVVKLASGFETVISSNVNEPTSIAVDDNGNIYIANSGDANILKAPQTAPGVWGIPAAVAMITALSRPTGVALDGVGNLYVTDAGLTQVLEKQYATAPSYTFFTPTPIGNDNSSGPAFFTVFNFGNSNLTASAPGLIPATDFKQWGGTCTSAFSLAANSNCSLNITFLPLSIGAFNNELFTLVDNNLGVSPSIQSITLSGTGVKGIPTIAVMSSGTPTSYGTSVTFTATVTGPAGVASPTGSVSFAEGGTAFPVCTTQPLVPTSPGVAIATCAISNLTVGLHSINATYAPGSDPNYLAAGASASFAQTVTNTYSTVTIRATPDTGTSNYGDALTFTATVDGVAGLVAPTGTVSFVDGVTPISCTNAPSNLTPTGPGTGISTATCNISTLIGESHSITARYIPGADPNYTTNDSSALAQTVNRLATTLAITSSQPVASSVNQSVTFVATVTANVPPNPPALLPTGIVSFTIGGNPSPDCPPATVNPVNGQATCTTSSLTAPSKAITATYNPDTNYSTSSAAPLTQTVNALHPTVGVTASPASPQTLNTNVTFTASLTGSTLTPVHPTGTMTFTLNGTTVAACTGAVNASGVKTCAIQNMPAGSNTVTATYTGDANYTVAAPGSVSYTMTALPGTLTITAAPGQSVAAGTQVTFTATITASSVAPVVPNGWVTWTISGNPVPECPTAQVVNRQATCITSSLVVPADVITAAYSLDTNYTPVPTANFTESVAKTAANTTLTSSIPSSSINQQVTFTATVTPPSGSVKPTGTVTFTEGVTTLCGAAGINSNTGVATCGYAFTSLTAGATITATYSGDQNFSSGIPATTSQAVVASATTTVVGSSPNPSSTNQQVTFTAAVTPVYTSGNSKPTGQVTFDDTSTTPHTTLCAVAIANGIVPVCNYTFTSSGVRNVVANYFGDTNFTGSTSATDNQSVGAASASVALTSLPATAAVNQQVTFTATNNTNSGTTKPQGAVTYTDTLTGTILCANVVVTATGNVPACTYAFATAGTHTVTAAFTTADTNFNSGASNVLSQTITQAATETSVSSSPNPSSINQAVAFTALVAPAYNGATKPAGTVVFVDTSASRNLCTLTIAGDGTVPVCNFIFASVGTHNVVATYTPSGSNFSSSISTSDGQTVAAGTTAVLLTSTPSFPTANQPLTFTATVTALPAGSTTLSGSVSFTDNATPIGDCASVAVVAATGVATCAIASLNVGSHSIKAVYGSDTNFSTSSDTIIQTASKLTPTLGLSSTGPSDLNAPATLTAQLSGVAFTPLAPNGAVSFTSNGIAIVGCSALTVDATQKAACITTALTAGSNAIGATYSGDSNYAISNASTITQAVAKLTPTLDITSSGSSSVGTSVTLTAQLSAVAFAPNAPTGSARFTSNGKTIPGCWASPLDAGGKAVCTTSALSAGSDTISATFSGDSNFSTASAPTINQTVSKIAPTIGVSLTAGAAPSIFGNPLTFSATVTGAPGLLSPTGTVSFVDNGATLACTNPLGTLATAGAGISTATCDVSTLSTGAHNVTATYIPGADPNYLAAGPSAPLAQTVIQAAPTLSLTCTEVTYDGKPHSCTGSATLVGGATVTGTWTYSPSSVTSAGNVSVTGTFTSSDLNYSSGTVGGTLKIDKASPVVTWTTPVAIAYGTSLSAAQLNASSTVAGIFVYTPSAGTVLSAGSQTLSATFNPTDGVNYTSATTTVPLTVNKATPSVQVTPASASITTAQALSVLVAVSGVVGPPPAGSVTIVSSSYTSAATALSNGSATISIPAGLLTTGIDTLTATYSGETNYISTTVSATVTVTTPVNPSFAMSGTAVAVLRGATTANTSTITVTPSGGFTGSVALTAIVTSSPARGQYPPTLSFGSTSPVSISGTTAGTAILTISTTAATSAAMVQPKHPGVPWYAAGGATLACILLFGIPARRRRWQTILGVLTLIVALGGGIVACGGSNSKGGGTSIQGTTAGIYTVTVTGTSGATITTGTVTLTVR